MRVPERLAALASLAAGGVGSPWSLARDAALRSCRRPATSRLERFGDDQCGPFVAAQLRRTDAKSRCRCPSPTPTRPTTGGSRSEAPPTWGVTPTSRASSGSTTAACPYASDNFAWGPDGGYGIIVFADRRGFAIRPVKAEIAERITPAQEAAGAAPRHRHARSVSGRRKSPLSRTLLRFSRSQLGLEPPATPEGHGSAPVPPTHHTRALVRLGRSRRREIRFPNALGRAYGRAPTWSHCGLRCRRVCRVRARCVHHDLVPVAVGSTVAAAEGCSSAPAPRRARPSAAGGSSTPRARGAAARGERRRVGRLLAVRPVPDDVPVHRGGRAVRSPASGGTRSACSSRGHASSRGPATTTTRTSRVARRAPARPRTASTPSSTSTRTRGVRRSPARPGEASPAGRNPRSVGTGPRHGRPSTAGRRGARSPAFAS